jgi:hypothetical protein
VDIPQQDYTRANHLSGSLVVDHFFVELTWRPFFIVVENAQLPDHVPIQVCSEPQSGNASWPTSDTCPWRDKPSPPRLTRRSQAALPAPSRQKPTFAPQIWLQGLHHHHHLFLMPHFLLLSGPNSALPTINGLSRQERYQPDFSTLFFKHPSLAALIAVNNIPSPRLPRLFGSATG